MRTLSFWLLVVLCVSCANKAPDKGTGGDASQVKDASRERVVAVTQQLCEQMCQVVAQVPCPDQPTMEACVSSCLGDTSPCRPAWGAYYACLVATGPASLRCDQEAKLRVLNPGFCVQEQADVNACFHGL